MTVSKEEPMDQMAEDHARYMRAKDLFDDARRSLEALLADDDAMFKMTAGMEGAAVLLVEKLKDRSAHIVAVWD